MQSMFGDNIWSMLVIAGPILLAVVIAWAMLHNKGSKKQVDDTEQATSDLYDTEAKDERERGNR